MEQETIQSIPAFTIRRINRERAMQIQMLWLRRHKPIEHQSYKNIKDEMRHQILHEILINGLTISQASEKYDLKYTTIKNITSTYMKEGRIDKKKSRVKKQFNENTIKKLDNSKLGFNESPLAIKEVKVDDSDQKNLINNQMS